MSPQSRRRGRGGGAATKAPEAEQTEDEDEGGEAESNGRRQRNTEPLPSGEELYNAKYVEGMTWQEIRDNLDERIRSPKGLSLIAEYVIENGLEDEHPEFADLSELDDDAMAEAIVEWHDSGQGWAVLAARTGLTQGEVRDIYEEAGGENPGRVGGQRYGGGRSRKAGEDEGDDNGDGDEAEAKPAKRRGAKPAKGAKAKPAKRARTRSQASEDEGNDDDNGEEPAKPAKRSRRRQRASE